MFTCFYFSVHIKVYSRARSDALKFKEVLDHKLKSTIILGISLSKFSSKRVCPKLLFSKLIVVLFNHQAILPTSPVWLSSSACLIVPHLETVVLFPSNVDIWNQREYNQFPFILVPS